jgi:hypothetical protein
MPRDGAITFGDIAGKLDVLNVECNKCGRRGRYHVRRRSSATALTLFEWSDEAGPLAARRRRLLIQQVAVGIPITSNTQIMSVFALCKST